MEPDTHEARTVEQLCTRCGLCCNGALFADVKLNPGERAPVARALAAAVAKPARARRPLARLVQPCAAFDGRLCRIYADRPSHCHNFVCALLGQVRGGGTDVKTALAIIRRTRARAARAGRLLAALGDDDVTAPLAARFRRTAARLGDGSAGASESDLFSQLTLVMHELNRSLAAHFYPG